jgi:hypothetical protein
MSFLFPWWQIRKQKADLAPLWLELNFLDKSEALVLELEVLTSLGQHFSHIVVRPINEI